EYELCHRASPPDPMTNGDPAERQARDALAAALEAEPGRVLSVLIRALGVFDLAEDALQDAVEAALERWPVDGVPANPGGWLVTVARHRAIDRQRRSSLWERKGEKLRQLRELEEPDDSGPPDAPLGDERLRLV